MKTALITGANRGIGLELTKQLSKNNYQVIACCRQSNPDLNSVDAHVIEKCDVTDPASLKRLSNELNDKKIDLLVNNAGILDSMSLSELNTNSMKRQYEVNAIAPLMVTQRLLNNMKAGAKVVIITSRMGSVTDNTSGGQYGYRMSKAAVNMAGKSLALDLHDQGIAVGLLHPGYVKTDMTNGHGEINADESARGLIERINQLNIQNTGGFWHANGQKLPW